MLKLQVLGPGCPKCLVLADRVEEAARRSGLPYTLEKVTDIGDILSFGVMMTPALAVNGEVRLVGRVPTVEEIASLLAGAAGP
jgi:small redox-active disulfide protein 2